MRKHVSYNIVIDGIIHFTTNRYSELLKAFDAIKKTEPRAWVQTCYS